MREAHENTYIELGKHCIGLDRKEPYKRHGKLFYKPYRNYYSTSKQGREVWDAMVAAGYAGAGEENGYGGRMYWMTREGLDWLGQKLGIKIWNEEN